MSFGAEIVGKIVGVVLGMPIWFWVVSGIIALYVLARLVAKGFTR